MLFYGTIILHNVFLFNILLPSGVSDIIFIQLPEICNCKESTNQFPTTNNCPNENNNDDAIPEVFPNASNEIIKGEKKQVFSLNQFTNENNDTKFCFTAIVQNVMKNFMEKNESSRVVSSANWHKYEEIAKNITENIVTLMNYFHGIHNILDSKNLSDSDVSGCKNKSKNKNKNSQDETSSVGETNNTPSLGLPNDLYIFVNKEKKQVSTPNGTNDTLFCVTAVKQNVIKNFIVANNMAKNESSKMMNAHINKYNEIAKNITENMITLINQFNEIHNILKCKNLCATNVSCANTLKSKKNNENPYDETNNSNSILVPTLLIVIILLTAYVGYLYRKFRTPRYRSSQMLITDEF